MAKIKNVQLKSVKTINIYDHVATTANVYLNNKKVGEIMDEGYGGGMDCDFISSEVEDTLFEIATEFYKENPTFFINPEKTKFGLIVDFIEDELLLLHSIEKDFKKNYKNGFVVTLLLESVARNEDPFAEGTDYYSPLTVGVKQWDDKTKAYVNKKYPQYKHIKVFKSLEDFDIK